jgi:hypothetical protein
MREAEAFFEDRGAGTVVATYRANAVIPARGRKASSPRSDSASGVASLGDRPTVVS